MAASKSQEDRYNETMKTLRTNNDLRFLYDNLPSLIQLSEKITQSRKSLLSKGLVPKQLDELLNNPRDLTLISKVKDTLNQKFHPALDTYLELALPFHDVREEVDSRIWHSQSFILTRGVAPQFRDNLQRRWKERKYEDCFNLIEEILAR